MKEGIKSVSIRNAVSGAQVDVPAALMAPYKNVEVSVGRGKVLGAPFLGPSLWD